MTIPHTVDVVSLRDAVGTASEQLARDLRSGVEEALLTLGNGFLSHPDNGALRSALQDGSLLDRDVHDQLLRLVYRLIVLLMVEERGLLHPEGTPDAARALYSEGYSLRRLRERSAKRSAHDQDADAWEAVKVVFRGVAGGEPRLGLPALAGLFAESQCPALDASKLPNRALMLAIVKLSWLRVPSGLSRVNWRAMEPEELGGVYESLLELVPLVSVASRSYAFAKGDEAKGNARKTSGSYYTPESLVQVLLDSALEPVIQATIAASPDEPAEALLNLSIVDPACGPGHFLLAAARRLAAHVARLQGNGTPSAAEHRRAVRQVVGRCIYGVDLNSLAVELCKVALWMEAVEPGLPLTFLDAHIQRGNALLGTSPELMREGIPSAAWDPIEGDDRKAASALRKRNAKEASGLRPNWAEILGSGAYRRQKLAADAWCAAFVWPKPKEGDPVVEAAPTTGLWADIRDGKGSPPALTVKTVEELAEQHQFFHWHLAFPTVFKRGGFDVVLGNPPWERVKLQEQEFFAAKSGAIASAANAAARKRLIAALPETDAALWKAWRDASRGAEGQSHFVRNSGRYPLCGKGDINTYALFAEHNRALLRSTGRAGFVVPTGIATDDTTSDYFASLVTHNLLRVLWDFQSAPGLFGDIGHARFKFCLLTVGAGAAPADLLFFARSVDELRDPERHFTLSPSDFATLNPNTRTCPTFRSRRDADINLALYRRAGVFVRDGSAAGNPWNLQVRTRLWHMAEDAEHFRSPRELEAAGWQREGNRYERAGKRMSPLVEAKMVHHYDHRYGDYADKPSHSESTSLPDVPLERLENAWYAPLSRYVVDTAEVLARLRDHWDRGWLLGWRDICRSFDERTVIASIIPRAASGDTFMLAMPAVDPPLIACLYGNLCSFALDYAARQKVGGTHLKYHTFKQLPVLPPTVYPASAAWYHGRSALDFVLPRVLELTYTAWDLEPFAKDVGCDGPPFRWDPARRFLLRCELDAAFFHLYGLSRADTDYILDTFPIVRRDDEKAHGEFRTKRVILEGYDAMADAARTGAPYLTRVDPPPADPRVAHPPRPPAPGR